MKKSSVRHSAPPGVCSNALLLATNFTPRPKGPCSPPNPMSDNVRWRWLHGLGLPRILAVCRPMRRAPFEGDSSNGGKTLGCGAHLVGKRQRLIGAVEEFNGHKDHFLVAKVLEVMDLELARSVRLVAG